MLSPTKKAPKISVYACMYGQHNFNKMLLAPMDCAVLLHNKPDIQQHGTTASSSDTTLRYQEDTVDTSKSESKALGAYELQMHFSSNTTISQCQP